MKISELKYIYSACFPFWDILSEKQKGYICNNSTAESFSKGAMVHHPNEEGGVILLKNGSLRVYMISEDEKELTLMRFHKNDLCILSSSCISAPIAFDIYIEAEEDCECYFITNKAYEKTNNECNNAKIFALETTIDCMSDMMWIMEQVLFMSMDKRLAIFLLDEINRCDTDTVMLTHSLIAKYMGSVREVVSRMLKFFENEGIVELSRRGVKILDKNKLRILATKKA